MQVFVGFTLVPA